MKREQLNKYISDTFIRIATYLLVTIYVFWGLLQVSRFIENDVIGLNFYAIVPLIAIISQIVMLNILYRSHRHQIEAVAFSFYIGSALIITSGEIGQRLALEISLFTPFVYISFIGAILSLISLIIFTIIYTGNSPKLNEFKGNFLILSPGFLFLIFIIFTDHILIDPRLVIDQYAWGLVAITGDYFWTFILWAALIVFISLGLLYNYYLKSKSQQKKKQIVLVMMAIGIPSFSGVFLDGFLSILGIQLFDITTVTTTLSIILITYSINKFGLFRFEPKLITAPLINIMDEAVLVLRDDLTISFVNLATIKMFGIDEKDLVGDKVNSLFNDFDVNPRLQSCFSLSLDESRVIQYSIKNKNGETIPVRISCQKILFEEPIKEEMVLMLLTDVSDIEESAESLSAEIHRQEDTQKALVNVLQDTRILEDQLRKERDLSQAILESIGEGLLVIDNDSRIILANPIAQKFFNRDEKDLYGNNISDLLDIEQNKEKVVFEDSAIFQALKNEQPVEITVEDKMIWINKDGRTLPVSLVAAPLLSEEEIIGVVVVFKDVLESSKLQEAREGFISVASHQLRTPLSAIRWLTELLKEEEYSKLSPSSQSYLDDIHTSTTRLTKLVNGLLNVSRIESGRLIVEPEKVDLKKLINSVIESLHVEVKGKQCKVNFKTPKQKIKPILLDGIMIRQVFYNLISNAIRYSKNPCKIEMSLEDQNNHIVFKIKDNGIGIEKSQQDRLFQKFFRAENAVKAQTEGTGLGLYIAKMVLDTFGATISVNSEIGKGTEFIVTIPKVGMAKKEGEVRLIAGSKIR